MNACPKCSGNAWERDRDGLPACLFCGYVQYPEPLPLLQSDDKRKKTIPIDRRERTR